MSMSDPLFYLVLAVAVGYWLWSVNRRKREALRNQPELAAGAHVGPVPGYSYLPGALMRWDPENMPTGLDETWHPISLETLHAGKRTRFVLTITTTEPAPTARFSIMRMLANRILERTNVQVLAIEIAAGADPSKPEILVVAKDGRGWTGTGVEAFITARLSDRGSFRVTA
jgi:hypothetical protein